MSNMLENSSQAVIIDNGSETVKAGLAASYPSIEFSSRVGRSRTLFNPLNGSPATFVGDECHSKRYSLNLTQPIQNGLVQDWNDLELIYQYCFAKLDVTAAQQPILIAEHASTPDTDREKLTELMFEKFNIPLLSAVSQAALALYATGRTTGIALDSGHTQTQCVAVNQGRVMPDIILDTEKLTGLSMNSHLQNVFFNERDYVFGSGLDEKKVIQEIKEKLCCVALNYKLEIQSKRKEIEFKLPDGKSINIGSERFKCAEWLFQPVDGFHEMILKCVNQSTDVNSQADYLENICLSGGNTMFPCMGERLKIELTKLRPDAMINVTSWPERKYLSWIGGAKWTLEQSSCWTSKQEYDEYGSSVVSRKLLTNSYSE